MQFSPDQCLHVAWPKCKHIRSSRRLKPEVPAPTRNTFFTFFHNAFSKCFLSLFSQCMFKMFFSHFFTLLAKIQKHVKHMWKKNVENALWKMRKMHVESALGKNCQKIHFENVKNCENNVKEMHLGILWGKTPGQFFFSLDLLCCLADLCQKRFGDDCLGCLVMESRTYGLVWK